jgi:hypothetical protein
MDVPLVHFRLRSVNYGGQDSPCGLRPALSRHGIPLIWRREMGEKVSVYGEPGSAAGARAAGCLAWWIVWMHVFFTV